jgi:hypothetical protein
MHAAKVNTRLACKEIAAVILPEVLCSGFGMISTVELSRADGDVDTRSSCGHIACSTPALIFDLLNLIDTLRPIDLF